MTPEQSRAARALLGWSQGELAQKAGVAERTVAGYERGERSIHANSVEALRRAFETAGVSMIEEERGVGVILRKKKASRSSA